MITSEVLMASNNGKTTEAPPSTDARNSAPTSHGFRFNSYIKLQQIRHKHVSLKKQTFLRIPMGTTIWRDESINA